MKSEPRIQSTGGMCVQADEVWSSTKWRQLEAHFCKAARESPDEDLARRVTAQFGRRVLRSYSSSFFVVTRFLPRSKRADVEMVYAAVRYPDEIIDTFDLSIGEKQRLLDEWLTAYERSLCTNGIASAVENGIPVAIAGFADVMHRNQIPHDYYADFIKAMRRDLSLSKFKNWDDLIDNYVYGSATVVGYFLAHIYGVADGRSLVESLQSARSLAIALQLTNFARDVADDAARSRCYLPVDLTNEKGEPIANGVLAGDASAMVATKHLFAKQAAVWYERSLHGINAFHPDSKVAIESCQRLYSTLNTKILQSESPFGRESLTAWRKFAVLPRSKFWRLPAAMVLER
jgi:phytoene synthase